MFRWKKKAASRLQVRKDAFSVQATIADDPRVFFRYVEYHDQLEITDALIGSLKPEEACGLFSEFISDLDMEQFEIIVFSKIAKQSDAKDHVLAQFELCKCLVAASKQNLTIKNSQLNMSLGYFDGVFELQ